MKCPECQHENPEDARFYNGCGAKLEKICPKCNSSNPPRFKFWGECGHNLTETADTENKAPAIDSERKHVTILFPDLSGYTSMTEIVDPEF